MFSQEVLKAELDDILGVPHTVHVLTPFSFSIRPTGLAGDEPGYAVVVQRSAFKMRAQVLFDPLGRRIRTAILAGVVSNSLSVERARTSMRALGWDPQIRISDYDLFIGATDATDRSGDEDRAISACISAAAILTEFVLAQLIVTRTLETRPAASRALGDPDKVSPVWEYDPSERDRATLQHRLLENWLIQRIREAGLDPVDTVQGPQFDLGWRLGNDLVVCEVKTTGGDATKQIRLGIGQVLHYRAQVRPSVSGLVRAALLIEKAPEDELWKSLCEEIDTVLFWPDDGPLPERLVRP